MKQVFQGVFKLESVKTKPLPRREFVALMTCMLALEALAIDSMLPALGHMGSDLAISYANDRQLIITSIFLGVALGVLGYGIAGDSLGRKRPVYFGLFVFVLGSILCALSDNFTTMLFGRVLQGLGAAGPYVLSTALIRDMYKGRQMAEIMSLVLMAFIFVPAVAPLIGQGILLISGWRSIFTLLGVFAAFVGIWFCLRQVETLAVDKRQPVSLTRSLRGIREVLSSRKVFSFILAEGCIFGAFVGFLSTSQQVLQVQYKLGQQFPIYFALMAAFLGLAAFCNSRWVLRLGMYVLVSRSLLGIIITSVLLVIYELSSDAGVPFWLFMGYMMSIYFCIGMVFGNLKSMAMEPMGHIAGIASAVIGSLSTIIGALLGAFIGSFYTGSVLPVVVGFALLPMLAKCLVDSGEKSST